MFIIWQSLFTLTTRSKAHIKPGAKQSVERVFVIFLVTRRRTIAVRATETSHSPAMYIVTPHNFITAQIILLCYTD